MSLKAQNIAFRYDHRQWILRGINIELKPGEILGLAGPSGRGKTTLARILAGYERPNEGSVTLDGIPAPISYYNPIQLVFQHPEKAVNPRWRMRDTLNESWKPNNEFLASLGIEPEWLNRWPNELSGGELQRFCVARALGPETRYLIADEITTMLDAVMQAQIWHVILNTVRERNLGLLVISHDMTLLNRICDRIIDLNDECKL